MFNVASWNLWRLSQQKIFIFKNLLIILSPYSWVSGSYLGHRIKYGNLEVGNTTQQLLSTTRPCCSIEFIESFLFWVILVTYNIGIYICIHIYKVSYIQSLIFLSSVVMFFLHCMLNILRHKKIFCEIDESTGSWHNPSSDVIFLAVYSEAIFPFMGYFFLKKTVFPLISLSLAYRWVNQLRYFR